MKNARLTGPRLALALTLCLSPASAVLAQPAAPAVAASPSVDWLVHTRRTLEDLRGKLNLGGSQKAAWDAWSAGVIRDAQEQVNPRRPNPDVPSAPPSATLNDTTPQRMARSLRDMRADLVWLQQQVVQLEAAQARTQTFYDGLDRNQKTIFDLFWHELHHRLSGHDDDPAPAGTGMAPY
jgi:hypothetical protein